MYYKKSRTVLEIIFTQTTHVNIIGTDESQYSRNIHPYFKYQIQFPCRKNAREDATYTHISGTSLQKDTSL